jgi:hypothetical protein
MPICFLAGVLNYLDRTNLNFAALQLNAELGFTPQASRVLAAAQFGSRSSTKCLGSAERIAVGLIQQAVFRHCVEGTAVVGNADMQPVRSALVLLSAPPHRRTHSSLNCHKCTHWTVRRSKHPAPPSAGFNHWWLSLLVKLLHAGVFCCTSTNILQSILAHICCCRTMGWVQASSP